MDKLTKLTYINLGRSPKGGTEGDTVSREGVCPPPSINVCKLSSFVRVSWKSPKAFGDLKN